MSRRTVIIHKAFIDPSIPLNIPTLIMQYIFSLTIDLYSRKDAVFFASTFCFTLNFGYVLGVKAAAVPLLLSGKRDVLGAAATLLALHPSLFADSTAAATDCDDDFIVIPYDTTFLHYRTNCGKVIVCSCSVAMNMDSELNGPSAILD